MPDTYSEAQDAISDQLARARADRALRWCAALVRHRGNIVRAAAEVGFSGAYGCALTLRLGLRDFARALREAAGQPARGRPRALL